MNRRLLLVDGHAVLYRAFHAIRALSTRAGTPTNALYGFIRALNLLDKRWQPTHRAVVLDGGLPTFRMELLPGYKAQRKPMPEALRPQIALTMEYLALAGVPCARLDAQEADDVIATLAERAQHEDDTEVLIASGDKDLFQLVNNRVALVDAFGKNEPARFGADAVRAKTGVAPGQIPDWLALVGDSADNIPGVPGVGPKTAAELINRFGPITDIYARLDEVTSDRIRAGLDAARATVERNLRMVTLCRDLPGVGTLETMRRGLPPSHAALRDFLARMEFHALLRELDEPTLF